MRKNEIQAHGAVNHTTEFPSGQRGWTQDPLLRLRRFESCLRHHIHPPCNAVFSIRTERPPHKSNVKKKGRFGGAEEKVRGAGFEPANR